MDPHETVECLKLLLDSVILNEGDLNFTLLQKIKPSSFEFVLHEAIYHLESIDD